MSKEELERLDDQGMSAWDSHDPDAWAAMFADDFALHDWTLPEPIRDREGVRQYLKGWVGAFPDMRMKQTNRVVGDDAVAAEVEFQGTNTGSMLIAGKEIPPTNKPVVGRGVYLARVRDGKIVEFHSYPDIAGMMMQLGFMPQM